MRIRIDGTAAMFDAFDDIQDAMVPDMNGYSIGTNVEYSIHQEMGTINQSGTAHLRPGFDSAVASLGGLAAGADSTSVILRRLSLEIERKTKALAPVDTGNLRASYRAERF